MIQHFGPTAGELLLILSYKEKMFQDYTSLNMNNKRQFASKQYNALYNLKLMEFEQYIKQM